MLNTEVFALETTKTRKNPARFGRYIGYGIGAVGLDLSYGLFYSYLSKYLTDVLLMPAAFLLILTPIARIWDGINDPMMGVIVDHTKTRMGKYRPWILIGTSCNAVILAMMFTNPGISISSAWMYVYVAVMYILWGMTNTMADIPYWSMVPSFTNDPNERNTISTIARTFSGIGQGIITIFTPYALVLLGTGLTDEERQVSAQGFSRWAIICAYYFDNVEGDITKQSTFATFGAVGSFLGLFVIPLMSKKYTRRTIYRFCLIIVIIGYIAMTICGPILHNMLLLSLAYIIASIGIASMFVNQTVMLADIVDYGEYKTGKRSESTTFAMKGFLQKMAYTIQTIVMFSGFGISGYDGNTQVQTPFAETTISVMTFVVPPILVLISFIIFSKKYKLYGELSEKVLAFVNARDEKIGNTEDM